MATFHLLFSSFLAPSKSRDVRLLSLCVQHETIGFPCCLMPFPQWCSRRTAAFTQGLGKQWLGAPTPEPLVINDPTSRVVCRVVSSFDAITFHQHANDDSASVTYSSRDEGKRQTPVIYHGFLLHTNNRSTQWTREIVQVSTQWNSREMGKNERKE